MFGQAAPVLESLGTLQLSQLSPGERRLITSRRARVVFHHL